MITVKYVGQDDLFHDKNTGEVFVNGKKYEFTPERFEEVIAVTGDVFEVIDGELSTEAEEEPELDLSKLKVSELKALLDKKGIDYKSNDSKDELIAKLK